MKYADRIDAGRQLGNAVAAALCAGDTVGIRALVLGVPRGGVIVASEVAIALDADLGLALARKIGAPSNPEMAIGAIGESGDPVIDQRLVSALGVSGEYIEDAVIAAQRELGRQQVMYRGRDQAAPVQGRVVVVVDDGIATGSTLIATLAAVRLQRPELLACAVPVGAPDSVAKVAKEVDVMVCPLRPKGFRAVGQWYDRFGQTSDSEVVAALGGR